MKENQYETTLQAKKRKKKRSGRRWNLQINMPRLFFFFFDRRGQENVNVLFKVTQLLSVVELGPEIQVFQFPIRTFSNTTTIQFHSSEVFLFVFPSSKFLEVKQFLGSNLSLLHFNIRPMEQFGDRRGRGEESLIPVFQSFPAQENLNS